MKIASFEAIARALQEASVRYLVAGGLAVNAHGYRPAIPVAADQFADPAQRETWARDKGMQVFQLWSDRHRETPIDIFVNEPFAFDPEYAPRWSNPCGTTCRCVS